MSTPGERIRDGLKALGAAFEAMGFTPDNLPSEAQLDQFKADYWDLVQQECRPRTAEISDGSTQSGLIVGSRLEWDILAGQLVTDGIVSLSTNRITIAADNGRFRIQLQVAAQFNATSGRINFQLRDAANAVIVGVSGAQMQTLRLESDSTLDRTDIATSTLDVDTTGGAVVFDVDCVGVDNLNTIFANRRILISEIR